MDTPKAATVIFLLFATGSARTSGQDRATQAGAASVPVATDATPVDQLSEEQRAAIVTIRLETQREAAPVAVALEAIVNESFADMLSERPDPAAQERYCQRAAESVARLIAIANRGMQRGTFVLTPAQRQRVKRERGKPGAPGDLLELIARVYELPAK